MKIFQSWKYHASKECTPRGINIRPGIVAIAPQNASLHLLRNKAQTPPTNDNTPKRAGTRTHRKYQGSNGRGASTPIRNKNRGAIAKGTNPANIAKIPAVMGIHVFFIWGSGFSCGSDRFFDSTDSTMAAIPKIKIGAHSCLNHMKLPSKYQSSRGKNAKIETANARCHFFLLKT